MRFAFAQGWSYATRQSRRDIAHGRPTHLNGIRASAIATLDGKVLYLFDIPLNPKNRDLIEAPTWGLRAGLAIANAF